MRNLTASLVIMLLIAATGTTVDVVSSLRAGASGAVAQTPCMGGQAVGCQLESLAEHAAWTFRTLWTPPNAEADSIYQRLRGTNPALHSALASHDLAAFMRIWLTNAENLGNTMSLRARDSLRLTTIDQDQLQAIKAKYDGLNNNAKGPFLDNLESVLILSERGYISEAEAKTLLGF